MYKLQVMTSLKTQKEGNIDWCHIQGFQKSGIFLNVTQS